MLINIRIALAIITVLVGGTILITEKHEFIPYLMFGLGTLVFLTGVIELKKERKEFRGYASIIIALFIFFVAIQMQFDLLELYLQMLLLFIIFSPLLFSKVSRKTGSHKDWKRIFTSRWFGIPLIFLLLFTYLGSQNLMVVISTSLVIAISISLIANWRLFTRNERT